MRCPFCHQPIDRNNAWKGTADRFYCSEFCADSEPYLLPSRARAASGPPEQQERLFLQPFIAATPFPTVRCLRNRRLSWRQDRPKRQLEIGSPRFIAATAWRCFSTLHNPDRRKQVRVSHLSGRNEFTNLPLTPNKLFGRDGSPEQLVDKPDR